MHKSLTFSKNQENAQNAQNAQNAWHKYLKTLSVLQKPMKNAKRFEVFRLAFWATQKRLTSAENAKRLSVLGKR